MSDIQQRANAFKSLHVKGQPVILYNIWDAGSAQAVASCGAKAIATGSHGVANAQGYEDGQEIPLDIAVENAKRVVDITDLPVTVDIETGYGETPDEVAQTAKRMLDAGAVGINFEDRNIGGEGVRDSDAQAKRIQGIRAMADQAGVPLFINARTDIFLLAEAETHGELLDEAVQRAQAYAAAGADGLFVPKLLDLDLIRQLCERVDIPVNIIRIEGAPSTQELAQASVARISYGPVPYLNMIEWLKQQARPALQG